MRKANKEISNSKDVAKTAAKAFNGEPTIHKFHSEKSTFVNLLTSTDQPCEGVSSYSTVGLSDHPNGQESIYVEIVGACASNTPKFETILTTAAFCIINSGWTCTPDTVFPDIVKSFECSNTMAHLLFVSPYIWEDNLTTLIYPDKKIAWLQAIPISEAEYQLALKDSVRALESIFEEKQIDIFDINRPSVV